MTRIMASFWYQVGLRLLVLTGLLVTRMACGQDTSPLPNNTFNQCGIVRDDGFRIIGGQDAADGQFPWMARLLLQSPALNFTVPCAGAIIGERHVLTVARCVQPNPRGGMTFEVQDAAYFNVYTGSVSGSKGTPRRVEKVIRHRKYDPYDVDYDIALLKLSEPIKFNYHESPVCINKIFPEEFDKPCRVLDWNKSPDTLQWAVDKMLDKTRCKDFFGEHYFEDFLCGSGGETNFCWHDAGAPYVCEEEGRWYLFGLASAHLPHKTSICTKPGKYSKVSFFKEWIERQMEK